MKRIKLGLIVGISLTLGVAANAELRTMMATGIVDSIPEAFDLGPFSEGDPITAVVVYDDETPDTDPGDPSLGVYPIINYSFVVGGYTGFSNSGTIYVHNDIVGSGGSITDQIQFRCQYPFFAGAPAVNGFPLSTFAVSALGPDTMFSSDAIPASLDFSVFSVQSMGLIFSASAPNQVSGPGTSIEIGPPVIDVSFSGTVASVGGDVAGGPISVDDSVSGRFFYDRTVADDIPADTTVGVYPKSAINFSVTVGDYSIASPWARILIYDDWENIYGQKIEGFFATALTAPPSSTPWPSILVGDPVNGRDPIGLQFGLGYPAPLTVLSSDALPSANGLLRFPLSTGTEGVNWLTFGAASDSEDVRWNLTGFSAEGKMDSDGDRILDSADSCPDLRQPVDFSGPEPVLLDPDTDGDGFGDMCDDCRLDETRQEGPCLVNESDELVAVGSPAEGPILLRWSIDFGESVTVYRPRCGATVLFQGCDTAETPCAPLGTIHRYTPQVTPDDLFTGSSYTLYCDLRDFLVGLDPAPGDPAKTIDVVATYTSEGHTSFEGTPIKQLFIASEPVRFTRESAGEVRSVSCSVAPDPWYTIYRDTAGPPVEVTLGIPLTELPDVPTISLNNVACDSSGLENPVFSTDGSTTFLCERTSAFNALGTNVDGSTARFVVEGVDRDGMRFAASGENSCKIDIGFPTEIDVDIQDPINLTSKGVTNVCLINSPAYDVTNVDPLSVKVASATVKVRGSGTAMAYVKDCSDDGLDDLEIKVETSAFELTDGEPAEVRGQLLSGVNPAPFVGRDTVRVVPGEEIQ